MSSNTATRIDHEQIICSVRKDKLTYLKPAKLHSMALQVQRLEQHCILGAFIEAGCALGGSTILIASQKMASRPLRVYDVFGTIPPPSKEDTADVHRRYETIISGKSKGIGGDLYYGYRGDLKEFVETKLADYGYPLERNNIALVQGLLQETMEVDFPVAFAHVDVDWHDPVLVCAEKIWPQLVSGGVMIFDDYKCWGGCRKAVDSYFAGRREALATWDTSSGALLIAKK